MKQYSMIKQRAAMVILGMLALAGCLLPASCTAEDEASQTITANREVPLAIGEASLSADLNDEGELTRSGQTRTSNPIDNLRLLYTFSGNEGINVRNNTLYKNTDGWTATAGSPILLDGRKGTAVGIYYTGMPEKLPVSETGGIKAEAQPYTKSKTDLWYYQRHTEVNNAKAQLDFTNLQCIYSLFRINVKVAQDYPGTERSINKVVIKYGTGIVISTEYNPLADTSTPITNSSYTINDLDLAISKNEAQEVNIARLNYLLPSQSQSNATLTVILTIDGKDYTATVEKFTGFTGMRKHTLNVTLKGAKLVVGSVNIDNWTVGYNGEINME